MIQHSIRIRIPVGGINTRRSETLTDCVSYAASKSNLNMAQVVDVLTHFVEGLVDKVGQSESVNVPGLGLFYPKPWAPRSLTSKLAPYCYPGFVASTGFKSHVHRSCPFMPVAEGQELRRHRQSNHISGSSHGRKNVDAAHPCFALRRLREATRKKAEKLGLSVGLTPC